jgi:ribose transport system ATP-binding protein
MRRPAHRRKPLSEVKDRSELIVDDRQTVFEHIPAARCRDIILQVKRLSTQASRHFNIRGEIVGFYGLVGAGKTELARAIYGADPYTGDIIFKGEKLPLSPDRVIEAGITLVPEERRSQGLFTILTIRGNIPVMNMKKISHSGLSMALASGDYARVYRQAANCDKQHRKSSRSTIRWQPAKGCPI